MVVDGCFGDGEIGDCDFVVGGGMEFFFEQGMSDVVLLVGVGDCYVVDCLYVDFVIGDCQWCYLGVDCCYWECIVVCIVFVYVDFLVVLYGGSFFGEYCFSWVVIQEFFCYCLLEGGQLSGVFGIDDVIVEFFCGELVDGGLVGGDFVCIDEGYEDSLWLFMDIFWCMLGVSVGWFGFCGGG